MERRLAELREGAREEGCDAYVTFSPPALAYLAGFFGSTGAAVVTGAEARFLCDFRYVEQANAQVSTGFQVSEERGALETRAGEWLDRLGVVRAAFDPVVTTVHQRDTLGASFGGELVPLPGLLSGLRQRKSREELERIRAASQLAEGAMLDLLERLEAGTTEREAAAWLEHEFKVRGAEKPSFEPIVLFGARSSLPHGMPGEARLEAGDVVLIDCGCIRAGYCSDLTRTYAFATIPGTWFEEIYRVTRTAQQAALDAVRPGMAAREVDAVARGVITEAGYGQYFGHGLGHGVGLEVHEAPRLNMEAEAILEAGMIITIEPGIYLPGKGGVRIEDLVAVTEDGREVLTSSSKELRVLGT